MTHHSEPAREAVAVPAGWKLVPIEPTPEMIVAGVQMVSLGNSAISGVPAWRAMLAAAPASGGLEAVRDGRSAIVHAVASLAAAISLLERTPKAKKAAPSDRMFDQMLKDYRKALDEARTALAAPAATGGESGEAERYRALAVGLQLERDQAQNHLRELEDRLIEATAKAARAEGRIEILESALKPSAATGGEAVAWIAANALPLRKDTRNVSHMAFVYASESDSFGEKRIPLYTHPAPSETGASLVREAVIEKLEKTADEFDAYAKAYDEQGCAQLALIAKAKAFGVSYAVDTIRTEARRAALASATDAEGA